MDRYRYIDSITWKSRHSGGDIWHCLAMVSSTMARIYLKKRVDFSE